MQKHLRQKMLNKGQQAQIKREASPLSFFACIRKIPKNQKEHLFCAELGIVSNSQYE